MTIFSMIKDISYPKKAEFRFIFGSSMVRVLDYNSTSKNLKRSTTFLKYFWGHFKNKVSFQH